MTGGVEDDVDADADADEAVAAAPLQAVPAPYFRGFGESIASTAGRSFNKGMLEVQKELEALLVADKANPFTKSRFASLGQLLATVRPVLNRHGFLIKQFSGTIRSHGTSVKRWYSIPIITLITHVDTGQWEAIVVDLPVEPTVYSHGSAMTFGKRYGLQSYCCMATVDDDGAATIQNRLDEIHNAKVAETAVEEIRRCKGMGELTKWADENRDALNNLPEGPLIASIRTAFAEKRKALEAQAEEPTKPKKAANA